jgi:hypothetical protein
VTAMLSQLIVQHTRAYSQEQVCTAGSGELNVSPAEGNLNRVVEIGECAVAAHPEPAPDHRTDLADPDVRLIDHGA